MAFKVDRSKVEEALRDAAAKTAGKEFQSVKWFKFEGREVTLRFLPPFTDEGVNAGKFWRIVAQHWHVTDSVKAPIVCPKQTPGLGGECPICDFVEALRADEDPAAKELAADIKAKLTYLFNVIDVNDPEYTKRDVVRWKSEHPDKDAPFKAGDPKLQVYAAPFSVYNSLISFYKKGGDVVDLQTGHNINIAKQGSGINTKYTVTPDLEKTAVDLDEDYPMINLDNVGAVFDFNKLGGLLSEGVGQDYEQLLESVIPSNVKALPKTNKALAAKNEVAAKPALKTVAKAAAKAVVEDDDDDDSEIPHLSKKAYALDEDDEDDLSSLENSMMADD